MASGQDLNAVMVREIRLGLGFNDDGFYRDSLRHVLLDFCKTFDRPKLGDNSFPGCRPKFGDVFVLRS